MTAGTWPRASKGAPCPSCGHERRCHVRGDRGAVRCYWPAEGNGWGYLQEEGEDNNGAYEVRYADAPGRPSDALPPRPPKPAPLPVADLETRSRIYSRLLELCEVPPDRLEELCAKRTLSREEVTELRLGYLPDRREWPSITAALAEEYGADALRQVPGFRSGGDAVELAAAGAGILIPYLHPDPIMGGSLVQAVRLELDAPARGGRYRWLSGAGGPSVTPAPYLYRPTEALAGRALVAEGEYKVIAAAKALRATGIGLPGVANYRPALAALAKERLTKVAIANDADQWTNPDVARGTVSLVRELQADGREVTVVTWWDPETPPTAKDIEEGRCPKGIDDAIAAGVELHTLGGAAVDDYCARLEEHHGLSQSRKEEEPEDPLAALATMEPGTSIALLRPYLKAVAESAKGMSKAEKALSRAELAQELKRLKVPAPGETAKELFREADASKDDEDDITLRPTEPTTDAVNAAEVLDAVESYICRYMSLPDGASTALALWVAHTYLIGSLNHSPRLAIQSPVKGCGKTTLMTLLAFLVEKPSLSAWPSPASIFREVEEFGPTLLLDEFDTWIKENEEIRGIINSGFFRPFGYVTRCEGDDHKTKRFRTFGAMALAGIDRLPPTIQDRSIVVSLKKKIKADQVDRVILSEALQRGRELKPALARFAADIADDISPVVDRTDAPAELEDRPGDLWRPLLAIADFAEGCWPEKARLAAVTLSGPGTKEDDDLGIMLIRDVYDAFERRGVDAIRSEFLLDDLLGRPDRPWKELNRGRPLSANKLGRMLGAFGVSSRRIGSGDDRKRGYHREDLSDIFHRYIFSSDPPGKFCPSVPNTPPGSGEPRNDGLSQVDRMWDGWTELNSNSVHLKNGSPGPGEAWDRSEKRICPSVPNVSGGQTAPLSHSGSEVDRRTEFSGTARKKIIESVPSCPEPDLLPGIDPPADTPTRPKIVRRII